LLSADPRGIGEGLIEPIIVCPIDKRNQIIAGERRLRAVRDYTEMETIEAQIVVANDLQARRISAAENLQREDLSAIEAIEAIVEIVDAELIGDKEYTHLSNLPMVEGYQDIFGPGWVKCRH